MGGRSVVLVEDDPSISEMYGRGLRWAGYNVTTFADPNAFLAAVDGAMPDVLILDWRLPGMDGGQVLELLRHHPRMKQVHVFILSNLRGTDDGAIDIALAAGARDWLEKSKTTPRLLAERIREATSAT